MAKSMIKPEMIKIRQKKKHLKIEQKESEELNKLVLITKVHILASIGEKYWNSV